MKILIAIFLFAFFVNNMVGAESNSASSNDLPFLGLWEGKHKDINLKIRFFDNLIAFESSRKIDEKPIFEVDSYYKIVNSNEKKYIAEIRGVIFGEKIKKVEHIILLNLIDNEKLWFKTNDNGKKTERTLKRVSP